MRNYIKALNAAMIDTYKRQPGRIESDYSREHASMQSYHGREILELLQNADDEMNEDLPKEAYISFNNGFLRISNYGEPFSKDGITSLTISDLSPKRHKAGTYIGNKGTGFRSILGWTDEIYIHSGDLHVKFSEGYSQSIVDNLLGEGIEDKKYEAATLVFPEWIDQDDQESQYTTDIIIKTKADDSIAVDIETQLKSIDQNILLFLNKMDTLIIEMPEYHAKYSKHDDAGKVILSRCVNGEYTEATWQLFKKTGVTYDADAKKDKPYFIILAHRDIVPLSEDEQKLYSFFKTDVKFPYQFLLHATFLLNQDRNHLIKGSDANEDMMQTAAELMVEAAIKLAKKRVANYDIIKLLVEDEFYRSSDLDGYDFKGYLLTVAKTKPIYPNVNGKYVSNGDELVNDQYGMSKYLSGDKFWDLLKYADSDAETVSGFLNDTVKYSKYQYESICNSVAEWIDKKILKATTSRSKHSILREIAHTAGAFFQAYKADIESEGVEKLPYFFFDSDCEQIKSRYVYYSEGETSISKPPTCLSVQFLNADMQTVINRYFEENNWIHSIKDMSIMGLYPFSVDDLTKKCNEVIQKEYKKKLKKADNDLGLILRWLYRNQSNFSSSTVNLLLPSKNGELRESTSLYMGEEYHNDICERLFKERPGKLLADIVPYMEKRCNDKDIISFLGMLGVEPFPRIFKKAYSYNIKSIWPSAPIFEIDYVKTAVFDFNYPVALENRQYPDANAFYSDINQYSGRHEEIDQLEYILKECPTEVILDWISSDKQLKQRLFNDKHTELIKGEVEILAGNLRNPRKLLSEDYPYSYIYHVFHETPWVEFNGKRYKPCDCLIGFDNNVNLTPYLIGIEVSKLSKERKLPDKKRKAYIEILEALGAKNGFGKNGFPSFPLSKIYSVFLRLPDIAGSETLAKSLYRSVIEDGDYTEDELKQCSKRDEFLSLGKILSNNGYLPTSSVYYKADNRIGENALSHYNLLALGTRENSKVVEQILGVKRLTVKTSLVSEPVLHPDHISFANDLRDFFPLAFVYRYRAIKSPADLSEEANKMRAIKLVLCSYVNVRYNDQFDEVLQDYEFAIPEPNLVYIKAPEGVEIRHNNELSYAVADAINACLDISSESGKLAHLYETSDRIACLKHEIEDEDLIRRGIAAYRSGLKDRDKFIDALMTLTGKTNEEIKEYIDAIDFEKWTSEANLTKLREVLQQLSVSVTDYNDENPLQPIDLRPLYSSGIIRFKEQYRKHYESFWYKKFKACSLQEKLSYVDKIYEFDSISIPVLNTIEFDAQKEVLDALGIDGHKYRIDPNKECEKNKKTWIEIITSLYPDYADEGFIDNNENTSLLYFGEFDELKRRYAARFKDEDEITENQKDHPDDLPSTGVFVQAALTKPVEKYEKQNSVRSKTVGFSEKSNKQRVETGKSGERIVYNTLLQDKKYQEVTWVSEMAKTEGVNPAGSADYGYDIRTIDKDGNVQYIEVKSSERHLKDGISFYLSDREYEFAREHSSNYRLYYVDLSSDDEIPPIILLDDIFIDGELNRNKYSVLCEKYHISAQIE